MTNFDIQALTYGLGLGLGATDVLFEAAIVGEHKVLVGQLQRAILANNGVVASGIARRMRMGSGLRGASRVVRVGGRALVVTNLALVGGDVRSGRAGVSKALVYSAAAALSIVAPGPGMVVGGGLIGLELGGATDPISKEIDRAVGLE